MVVLVIVKHIGIDVGRLQLFLPYLGQGVPVGNGVQPGRELGLAFKAVQLLVGLYKTVLGHLLGIFPVLDDLDHQGKDQVLVPVDQGSKGVAVYLQHSVYVELICFCFHGLSLGLQDSSAGYKLAQKNIFYPGCNLIPASVVLIANTE